MVCILMMVMLKPIQFTMVSEAPLEISAACRATKVENSGESAITTNPQNNKKLVSNAVDELNKNKGESKQHRQDNDRAMAAIFFSPNLCENNPAATHANAPHAMIMNDHRDTLMEL